MLRHRDAYFLTDQGFQCRGILSIAVLPFVQLASSLALSSKHRRVARESPGSPCGLRVCPLGQGLGPALLCHLGSIEVPVLPHQQGDTYPLQCPFPQKNRSGSPRFPALTQSPRARHAAVGGSPVPFHRPNNCYPPVGSPEPQRGRPPRVSSSPTTPT